MKSNLNSSIISKGKIVTEIIHFKGGIKKTISGIIAESISQSEFTHMELVDGRTICIYTPNVLMFEVIKEQ